MEITIDLNEDQMTAVLEDSSNLYLLNKNCTAGVIQMVAEAIRTQQPVIPRPGDCIEITKPETLAGPWYVIEITPSNRWILQDTNGDEISVPYLDHITYEIYDPTIPPSS